MSTARLRLASFLSAEGPAELDAWLGVIDDLGGWATVALELAAARLLHPFWARYPLGGSPGEALTSTEATFRCPCSMHASAAYSASQRAEATADHPVLSDGYTGDGAPPPIWSNAAAALAVAAARVAGDAAWRASKCSEPDRHPLRFHGLAASVSRCLPGACHPRLREHLRRALLPWATSTTEEVLEPADGEELRRELMTAALAEAAIALDPSIVEARADRALRDESRARRVAAHASLLAMDALPCGPGAVNVGAFFGPSFHESCVVEVTLPQNGAGMLRIAGFGPGLFEFRLDSLTPGGPLTPPAVAWDVRRPITDDMVQRARARLDEVDPWTLGDEEAPGRDGISCYGQVSEAGRAPQGVLAWSPWYVGAQRHSEFFDVLIELAVALVDEGEARRVLDAIDRYRRL